MLRHSENFGVYDGIKEYGVTIISASSPACPTDTKAGHSDRFGENTWMFNDGEKWEYDNTITVQ